MVFLRRTAREETLSIDRALDANSNIGKGGLQDAAALGHAAGENVKVVQERLGHASAKMTLVIYAKIVPGPRQVDGNSSKRGAVAQLVRAPACHFDKT
jgi:integrase